MVIDSLLRNVFNFCQIQYARSNNVRHVARGDRVGSYSVAPVDDVLGTRGASRHRGVRARCSPAAPLAASRAPSLRLVSGGRRERSRALAASARPARLPAHRISRSPQDFRCELSFGIQKLRVTAIVSFLPVPVCRTLSQRKLTLTITTTTENPRKLLELQEQYGNVISYPMFGQRIVLLSGADVIRNALQDEALAGRPGIGIAEEITKGWGARLFYLTRLLHSTVLCTRIMIGTLLVVSEIARRWVLACFATITLYAPLWSIIDRRLDTLTFVQSITYPNDIKSHSHRRDCRWTSGRSRSLQN